MFENKRIAIKILNAAKCLNAGFGSDAWKKVKSDILKELKKYFNDIAEKNEKFSFDYCGYTCSIEYVYNWKPEPIYYINCFLYDGKKLIDTLSFRDSDLKKVISLCKKKIDLKSSKTSDEAILEKYVSKYLNNWYIENISKSFQGLTVEISKKAYGNGYDVFCQVKNGKIVDSDSNNYIVSETEKIIKDSKIKDFTIVGYAD